MPLKSIYLTVPVNADGDGTVTANTNQGLLGPILSVQYIKASSGGYANGVDFNVTLVNSGQTVWAQSDVNASVTVRPKVLNQATAGTDLTAIYDHIYAHGEPIRIVVAQGGVSTTGKFVIFAMDAPPGGIC